MDMGEQPGNGGYEGANFGQEPYDEETIHPMDNSGVDPDMLNGEIASDAEPVSNTEEELPPVNEVLQETLRGVFEAAVRPAYVVSRLGKEAERTTAELARQEAAYAAIKGQYEERIAILREAAAYATHGVEAAGEEIIGIFRQGRIDTWRLMDKTDSGYAVGEESALAAVALSPKDNKGEELNWHIARAVATSDLNRQVKAGVPVLFSKREGGKVPVYCAAVPEHDGLSVRLDDHDPKWPVYMLGVGDQTNMRVDDALAVIPGDDQHPLYAAPTFEVETGETAVAGTLTNDCKMFISAHEAIQTSIAEVLQRPATRQFGAYYRSLTYDRQALRDSMVASVTAARQLDIQPDIGPASQVAATVLCEHMLDAGDTDEYNAEQVRTIAEALQYIYPRDATVSVQEFIVNASRQRELNTRGGHRQPAVVVVLRDVLGMDYDDAMSAVYDERN
jgi:hypothetical protein